MTDISIERDELGIVTALQAKRGALVATLSPAARHAAFPHVYAQPVPSLDELSTLRQKVRELTEARAGLLRRVDSLEDAVRRLTKAEAQRERKALELPVAPPNEQHSFSEVMGAYLEALASVSYTISGDAVALDHLRGPQRAREFVWAKQVGVWLTRKLCLRHSYPMLARAFNYLDHSTLCHSMIRAPGVMERSPKLRAAAQLVISRFEGTQP